MPDSARRLIQLAWRPATLRIYGTSQVYVRAGDLDNRPRRDDWIGGVYLEYEREFQPGSATPVSVDPGAGS